MSVPAAPLAPGDRFTDFTLNAIDGSDYSSRQARQTGLLLAILFKTGCGTCRYSFPFLQRFHEQYAVNSGRKFQVWGISQDDAETTETFAQEQQATFPLLLDKNLHVTVRCGITHVPDLYLLGSDDSISAAVVGHFSRDGFNDLARRIAEYLLVPYVPIVRDEDDAPALKPG